MTIEDQINQLIKEAPQDGKTASLIEAVAPVLKQVAQSLQHTHYFIAQSAEQQWLTTVLSNRNQPDLEKIVVYAFAEVDTVRTYYPNHADPDLMTVAVPVVSILFQILALKNVESIVFFEGKSIAQAGMEIQCQKIQDLVRQQLQKYHMQRRANTLPPDIA
ncbi:MAG: hypothetical protein AAGF24_04675 [Cyanobacteria bacterium P01_H01_bin.121]